VTFEFPVEEFIYVSPLDSIPFKWYTYYVGRRSNPMDIKKAVAPVLHFTKSTDARKWMGGLTARLRKDYDGFIYENGKIKIMGGN
jgi:hypothetical protein